MSDIAAEIWAAVVPEPFPDTAEGRADVDRRLREKLLEIEDETVRSHASQIIRYRRAEAMFRAAPQGLMDMVREEVRRALALERRQA